MTLLNPIVTLVLSICLVTIFIKLSIINRKVLKNRLSLSFLLVFGLAMVIVFFDDITRKESYDKVLQYVIIGLDVLISIIIVLNINSSTNKSGIDKEFIKALETDKYFVLLDKKERIKRTSSILANEFGLEQEQMLGKKFFDLLEDNFDIVSFNGQSMDNKMVKDYFKNYYSKPKENAKEKREFELVNSENESFVWNLTDITIFSASKYQGHLMIGDKCLSDTLLTAEQKVIEKNQELEEIKDRFVTHLEITEEAIFFYNIKEKYVWGNDAFVNKLVLNGNSILKDDLEKYIYPDDLVYYNKTLASLTKENPNYDITYRFKTGVNYVFVREVGKRNFSNKHSDEIVGYIELVKNKHFESSNIDELDNIKSIEELNVDIDYLYRDRKVFEVVSFKMMNIPLINEAHGRSVGNMVLGEYIKAVTNAFVNDNLIYRLSGLEFIFIITDFRKMDSLKKMLEAKKLTSTIMQYGNMKVDVEANYGIAISNETLITKEIIDYSLKALKMSQMDQVSTSYLFHKDIR